MSLKKILNLTLIYLIICQVFDGYLTYLGISRYGLEVEANPIIHFFISLYGVESGLIIAKLICISILISILVVLKYKVNTFKREIVSLYSNMLIFVCCCYTIALCSWCLLLNQL